MTLRMTRQEYEQKFGSAPQMPTSNIDIKPAPLRMTREEFNQTYKKPAKQSFAQDFKQDIRETRAAQQTAVNTGVDRNARIEQRVASGETSKAKGFFQKVGGGLFTAADIIGQTAIGAGKAVLPQSAEEKVAQGAEAAVSEFKSSIERELVKNESGTPEQQAAAADIRETISLYETDQNFKDTVDAAGGVASWLALPSTARTAVVKTGDVVSTASKQIDVKSITPTFRSSDQRLTDNRANTIRGIEEANVQTRKANEFEKDGGAASRTRISETDVLAGAVDNDGLIRTKQPGGAVDQYRKLTVDGIEDVVKKNLEREGNTITLPEIKRRLIAAVSDPKTGLEGSDLVTALKGIENELKGLAIRSDNLNTLSLARLQDAKIGTTRNINFNTPPETKTYRKAIARAYKETIEAKSEVNVKEINSELAKYYKDIERLERLDGKRVKGGRAGKYFAQVSGNVVGGAAGSVGGGAGAALGALAGGELASAAQGRLMASTFGKGGKRGTTNKVLDVAAKEATLPNGRSLDVPDQAVAAPRSIKKTKEMLAVERRIKDNVKQQKVAIKAKDYNLVAALKQVYDALKEQLIEMVEDIRKNGPSVGLSIRKSISPEKTAADMTPEDADILRKFLADDANTVVSDDTYKMFEAMEIDKAKPEVRDRFLKDTLAEYNQRWEGVDDALTDTATTKTTLLEEARKMPFEQSGENVYFRAVDTERIEGIKKNGFSWDTPYEQRANSDMRLFAFDNYQDAKEFAETGNKRGGGKTVVKLYTQNATAENVNGKTVYKFDDDAEFILADEISSTTKMERFTSQRPIKLPGKVYRGVSDDGGTDIALYGQGLYTTSNKKYAQGFGNLESLSRDAIPENPIQFDTEMDFKQWEYELAKSLGVDKRELYKVGETHEIIKKLGYDGLTVGKGKDMVLVKF